MQAYLFGLLKDVSNVEVLNLLSFYIAWHTISTQAVSSFLNLNNHKLSNE
ncbi:hypothetical protein ACJIZ3_003755 [Penstemon smallii]|uniref:Uncharacterized protein n=1 Tax=Penstemon smallii TaxID=265156 RepID=A0ABD3S064_9LAMI